MTARPELRSDLGRTILISVVAEDLCLNYANTLSWRGSEPPSEALHDLADLIGWLEKSAGIGTGGLREVATWSRGRLRTAAKVVAEAKALREVIHRVFSAVAGGARVGDPDFRALMHALDAVPVRRTLVRAGAHYAWRIAQPTLSAPHLLAPVLWSAADLLLDAPHRQVRQCANGKCLWLFLDQSKNATRRWCDMASCGNRAKARRHYLKSKRD